MSAQSGVSHCACRFGDGDRGEEHPRHHLGGVQRLDHLVGDVVLGIDVDRFLQDQVVLFGFGHLLDDRLARSSTCCSSSFLRAFRSSWNSRRLRWKSRSWSISCLLPRGRAGFRQRGRLALELVGQRLELRAQVVQLLLALAEFLLELGLRRLGGIGLAEDPVGVDEADRKSSALNAGSPRAARPAGPQAGRKDASSEGGSNLELQPLDSIARLLAQRLGKRDAQRADGDIQDMADAGGGPQVGGSLSFSPNTLPTSTKPNMRSVRSLPAPGNGAITSAFSVSFFGAADRQPVTSRGPSVPCSKPRTEPRPPE
jgi:hypothetical protein